MTTKTFKLSKREHFLFIKGLNDTLSTGLGSLKDGIQVVINNDRVVGSYNPEKREYTTDQTSSWYKGIIGGADLRFNAAMAKYDKGVEETYKLTSIESLRFINGLGHLSDITVKLSENSVNMMIIESGYVIALYDSDKQVVTTSAGTDWVENIVNKGIENETVVEPQEKVSYMERTWLNSSVSEADSGFMYSKEVSENQDGANPFIIELSGKDITKTLALHRHLEQIQGLNTIFEKECGVAEGAISGVTVNKSTVVAEESLLKKTSGEAVDVDRCLITIEEGCPDSVDIVCISRDISYHFSNSFTFDELKCAIEEMEGVLAADNERYPDMQP